MAANSHSQHAHSSAHHITPISTYIKVFVALIVGTIITIAAAGVHFGVFNTFIAMLIATTKASLVILFFMHQKYENRLNQVIFFSSFVFLVIFFSLTASDLFFRVNTIPIHGK